MAPASRERKGLCPKAISLFFFSGMLPEEPSGSYFLRSGHLSPTSFLPSCTSFQVFTDVLPRNDSSFNVQFRSFPKLKAKFYKFTSNLCIVSSFHSWTVPGFHKIFLEYDKYHGLPINLRPCLYFSCALRSCLIFLHTDFNSHFVSSKGQKAGVSSRYVCDVNIQR